VCYNQFDNQKNIKFFLETHAKFYIQQKILGGCFLLVWSYILEYENEQNPFEHRKKAILKWKEFASEYIVENETVLAFGESLFKKGLKPKDALHVSCAKYANCDYFFTTDKGILKKKIDDLKIMNPIDSVLRIDGINALIEKLGPVDAERFISSIIKEDFDYTVWQRRLFEGKSLKCLSQEAMKS